MQSSENFPNNARVVIIGGGIIGCSTAYHLAKLGWKDVVLLERHKLTSGSTFHAAGLIGQLRSNANVTRILKYSVELYEQLEAETGQSTGWKRSGCLRLACNNERMIDYKRQATTAHSFGLDMEILSAQECCAMWPIMDGSDVVGGCYLPTDGQANPSDITQALARGARNNGVRIIEHCNVESILLEQGKVAAVATPLGRIQCENIVNCAGQWAREVGEMAGVSVPLVSVQHQYFVTEKIQSVASDMPTIRDPDRRVYFKEEVGGLIGGVYEPNPVPWGVNGIPAGFNFSLLDPDWEHFEPAMQACIERVPALDKAGIKSLISGPESFTPDGNFIIGEAPEVGNFYVGAGFNAFGIASAGGAGKVLAEWVVGGEAPMDLWAVDIRRFGPHHGSIEWTKNRTLELYGKHYSMPWPFEEHQSGRPHTTSPLYQQMVKSGACFGERMGWERPNWFAPSGVEPKDIYSFNRQNWFKYVGDEHCSVRQSVGIIDQSSFAKFELAGKDAEKAMSWICANQMDRPVGRVIYTQMLNRRGGIESDLTAARISKDCYYIVTGTGFRTHDYAWINQHISENMNVVLSDITEDYFTLSLMGPNARAVLEQVTTSDLSNDAFPFAHCREINIDGATVRALRITYVGELGWELHGPKQYSAQIYRALTQAGRNFSIRNVGYRAIESLRLEKGYRAWGADIGPDYTPFEAGLGWAVKLNTNTPFVGRQALERDAKSVLKKKLACFTVEDPDVVLIGRETIYRNNQRVGWLSSAGWGYTVNCNIGYGYVRCDDGVSEEYLSGGIYELEVATERVPCQLQTVSLYDPEIKRIKV